MEWSIQEVARLAGVSSLLDGFDHTQHREEVEERWGKEAYARSDAWWRSLGAQGQAGWKETAMELGKDWIAAAEAGIDPASDEAQALAARHARWLAGIPGTPGHTEGHPDHGYLLGLAEMYVADERFAKNYGGREGASWCVTPCRLRRAPLTRRESAVAPRTGAGATRAATRGVSTPRDRR